VQEYICEFERFHSRISFEEEPEQTTVRFLQGLDLSIAKKVDIQPYCNSEDIYKLAMKMKKVFQE